MGPKKPPTGRSADQSEDKRRSEREPVLRAADLILDEKRAPVACLVQDVSDTGLKLIYDSPHDLPDRVLIVLLHPRKEIWCEVIWRQENEVGLSIVHPV